MISPYLILGSLIGIAILLIFKSYEQKTGRSFWRIFRIEKLSILIENAASIVIGKIEQFDVKKVSTFVKETAIIVLEFYRAIQKISAEKFQKLSSVQPESNGNKAASFYLKNIKEHKEKIEDSL